MRIAVCDDDQNFCREMLKCLQGYFKEKKLKQPEYVCFSSGEAMMKAGGIFDMAFLDVEMDGISGIHAGEYLKKKNDKILIFIVTSFPEYLDEAMSFRVFRYLSKPLDKARLYRNLEAALKIYTASNRKVAVETKEGMYSLTAESIVMVEAVNRKVIVHTKTKEFEDIRSMNYWEEQLGDKCFYRSHRSFIVNMQHILHFDRELIYMENGKKAYLTRRKYKEFKDAYLFYLESAK